jgi:hypothetical protein
VPFKANAKCRHHIPKRKRRLTNWPAYEAGLRQRGDLTVWFTEAAIAAWRAAPRTCRGGQPWYSPLAILIESMQSCGVCSELGKFWAHGTRVSWCRRWIIPAFAS